MQPLALLLDSVVCKELLFNIQLSGLPCSVFKSIQLENNQNFVSKFYQSQKIKKEQKIKWEQIKDSVVGMYYVPSSLGWW